MAYPEGPSGQCPGVAYLRTFRKWWTNHRSPYTCHSLPRRCRVQGGNMNGSAVGCHNRRGRWGCGWSLSVNNAMSQTSLSLDVEWDRRVANPDLWD